MPGDSVFLKGSTHLVCEDYAQHDEGFALVSDGCSSAPRSDVAARLVYLGAHRTFAEALRTPDLDAEALKTLDLKHLTAAASDERLYATFLAARVLGTRVAVTVVGDGGVVVSRHGAVEQLKFHYPRYNAPYYPAYALDPASETRWRQEFPENPLVIEKHGTVPERAETFDPWITLEWETAGLEWILLVSDGLSSFTNADGQPADENPILDELCAFRNRAPGFLKRRVIRLTDDLSARGIVHRDDFSAAVLTFE